MFLVTFALVVDLRGGAGRRSVHQSWHENLLRGQVTVRGASHRALRRQLSHERRILIDGGQRDEAGVRPASIVEADDAHLLRCVDARLLVQA